MNEVEVEDDLERSAHLGWSVGLNGPGCCGPIFFSLLITFSVIFFNLLHFGFK
jgi:hypothetical protein